MYHKHIKTNRSGIFENKSCAIKNTPLKIRILKKKFYTCKYYKNDEEELWKKIIYFNMSILEYTSIIHFYPTLFIKIHCLKIRKKLYTSHFSVFSFNVFTLGRISFYLYSSTFVDFHEK